MEQRADSFETEDKLMMSTPSSWPSWPFLPLVRYTKGEKPELAFLFEHAHFYTPQHQKILVFLNEKLFDAEEATARADKLLSEPFECYVSVDAIYQAGWRVD